MIEKIYLLLTLIFFILAFAIRNIKTYFATKQSIKGKSPLLTLSISISTLIYLIIILRILVLEPSCIFELDLPNNDYLNYIGIGLVTIGFILGILALIEMKNSWRVGIKYDQKTKLVNTGIYRFSRNPYFLSYSVLIWGYILVFPSPILLVLWIPLAIIFHKTILDEEKYLESVHGKDYLDYKKKVNRYISLK